MAGQETPPPGLGLSLVNLSSFEGPPFLRFQDVTGDQRMGLGGVGAGDEKALRLGAELRDRVGHCSTAKRGDQTGHRGGVSEASAVIHVIGANHCAGELLEEIVLLVGALG